MKLKINFGLAKELLAKKMNINLLKEKANARITKFLNRNKKTTIYGIGDNFFDTLVDLQTPGNIFSGGLIFILNVCVGLVVSCTMYGFYSLFKRGEI